MKDIKATLDQAFDWLKRVKDAGLLREQLQQVFNSGLLADIFEWVKSGKPLNREAVRKALGLEPLLAVYSVVVDYNLSLADMIKAGEYDWINDDITSEHFPIQGEGKQELEIILLHFDRYVSSDEANKEIDKAGYRSATLPELLALGASQPELQRQFPIIALGSVWQDRHGACFVPCLLSDGAERSLRLGWLDNAWYPGYRFAIVRK